MAGYTFEFTHRMHTQWLSTYWLYRSTHPLMPESQNIRRPESAGQPDDKIRVGAVPLLCNFNQCNIFHIRIVKVLSVDTYISNSNTYGQDVVSICIMNRKPTTFPTRRGRMSIELYYTGCHTGLLVGGGGGTAARASKKHSLGACPPRKRLLNEDSCGRTRTD